MTHVYSNALPALDPHCNLKVAIFDHLSRELGGLRKHHTKSSPCKNVWEDLGDLEEHGNRRCMQSVARVRVLVWHVGDEVRACVGAAGV